MTHTEMYVERKPARRCRLKMGEKRAIALSSMPTKHLAKIFQVSEQTIHAYREPPKGSPMQVVESANEETIKALIHAYEDGRWARRHHGDGAVCHYQGQAAVAWKLGHDSK
jgi:hypothetical protein